MEYSDAELVVQRLISVERTINHEDTFSLLLNIPGQIYTIGTKYISREEQGEFIKLDFESYCDFQCKISCDENGKFWFRSIHEAEVKINGRKANENMQLQFGDSLTFCFLKNMADWNKKSFRVIPIRNDITFLFKKRMINGTLKREELGNEKNNELNSSKLAFGYRSIVSAILSYLPFESLKATRLVCKFWNEEGLKLLRKISMVKLTFEQNTDGLKQMTFFRYSHEMRAFKPQNMSLEEIPSDVVYTKKLGDDAIWFSKQVDLFSNLKCISLGLGPSGGILQPFILSIAHQIEELLLVEETWATHLPEFSSLKRLTIKEAELPTHFGTNVDDALFVPKIKNISALFLSRRIRESMKNFYGTIMEDITEFSNLSEIYLKTLDHYTATQLFKINSKLKVLELGEFQEPVSNIWSLEQLLKKNCQSLEKLHFALPLVYCIEGPNICIPKFPKLRHFKLEFLLGSRCKPFKFNYGSPIPYFEFFPKLQSLTISPMAVSDQGNPNLIWARLCKRGIIGQFFPPKGKMPMCKTLKYLHVPFVRFLLVEKDDNVCAANPRNFSKMFPNVQNW